MAKIKSSEQRARVITREILEIRNWNTKQVSKGGNLLEESEYKNYTHLDEIFKNKSKTGKGDGYPDFLLVESPHSLKPIIIIETKASVKDSNKAIEESIHYGNACVEKGHNVLCVGISGAEKEVSTIEVKKYLNGAWENLTLNGKPIDWIPSLEQAKRILHNNLLEVEPERPSEEILIAKANRLNEIFRECKIKDEYRPVCAATFMLALWFGPVVTNSSVVLSQINSNVERALTVAGKYDLIHSLKIDEDNEILAEKAWEVIDILKRLNIDTFIHEHDYLGQLYETFFRYTGSNTIGQYFTPRHIIDFICELLEITHTDTVFDPTCGTGGFLIGALNQMIKSKNMPYEESIEIVKDNIFGIEVEPTTASLCITNMILRGDGKSGIIKGDCTIQKDYPVKMLDGKINSRIQNGVDFALMNPPFPHKKTDTPTSDFIDRGLASLKKRGILASIVPYSLLVNTKDWHKRILKDNTLLHVVTLPTELFNPYASYNTAIIFIKKGIAHGNKKVFFSRIVKDGYKMKKNSRVISGESQLDIIKEAYSSKTIIPELTAYEEINENSREWSPEAYIGDAIHSDSKFIEEFEDFMRLHASFYIRYGNKIIGSNNKKNNNINITENIFNNSSKIDLTKINYGEFDVPQLFDVKLGGKYEVEDLEDGENPIITTSEFMNGVTSWKSAPTLYNGPCITVATDGSTASSFVQEFSFYAFYKVAILTAKYEIPLNALYYIAFLLKNQKWRYVYARKFGKQRISNTKLIMPIKDDGSPDFETMCKITEQSSSYPIIKHFRDVNSKL